MTEGVRRLTALLMAVGCLSCLGVTGPPGTPWYSPCPFGFIWTSWREYSPGTLVFSRLPPDGLVAGDADIRISPQPGYGEQNVLRLTNASVQFLLKRFNHPVTKFRFDFLHYPGFTDSLTVQALPTESSTFVGDLRVAPPTLGDVEVQVATRPARDGYFVHAVLTADEIQSVTVGSQDGAIGKVCIDF